MVGVLALVPPAIGGGIEGTLLLPPPSTVPQPETLQKRTPVAMDELHQRLHQILYFHPGYCLLKD